MVLRDPIADLICPTVAACEFMSTLALKNISVFQKPESDVWVVHPASLAEGRIAIVTGREAGMRWTQRRCQTSGAIADGEAAWFWHPLAGAKLATMLLASRR
jgi:hypothetical protein